MTKLVWLDAGHGGTDPGAVGNGLQEKNIVLQLVNRCGAYLLANYDNVAVRYSRTTDVFVSLADRTRLANDAKADIFVSVHCNSAANASANGFETFVTNTKLTSGSTALQTAVHNAIWDFYKKNGISSDRGRKSQNLHVLRESNMPSVLTENLFMPNSEILKFNDNVFLQGVAEAHAKGIASYLKLKEKKATSNNSNNNSGQTHIVKGGETLSSIAKQYNTTVDALVKANNIANPNMILTGTVLTIPTNASGGSSNSNSDNNSTPSTSSVPTAPSTPSTSNDVGLVDWMKAQNMDSSFANRAKLAQANGINNYTGTAAQNTQLLNILRGQVSTPVPTQSFFPATRTVGSGLVDTLNSIKVDSSFANRQRIATANGISNYSGTAAQNNQMLGLLNNGRLVRP